MVIGAFIRPAIRYGARAIYQALKVQDRIIDKTYRKAGLYNRGVVRGIQHGLAGGQIVGGLLSLGLDDSTFQPGNNAPIQPRNGPSARTPNKTRNRFSTRYGSRNTTRCYPRFQRRRSSPRKYYRS